MKVWTVHEFDDVVVVYDNSEAAALHRDSLHSAGDPWVEEWEVLSSVPLEHDPAQRPEYERRRAVWESLPDRPGFLDWLEGQLGEGMTLDRSRKVRMQDTTVIIAPVLGGYINPGGGYVEGDGTKGDVMSKSHWDPLRSGKATQRVETSEWVGDKLVAQFGSGEWMTLREVADELGISYRDAQAAVDRDAGVFLLTPRRRKTPVAIPTTTMGGKRMVQRQGFEEVLARR